MPLPRPTGRLAPNRRVLSTLEGCILSYVVVESATSALEYGDLVVDEGSPVNPDLHFDSQLMHLYVMTEKKDNSLCPEDSYVFLWQPLLPHHQGASSACYAKQGVESARSLVHPHFEKNRAAAASAASRVGTRRAGG
ncbi:Protein of unknown function [Gryllus bimaculatus]|nr:Protein of unknown function [Gryllus bimaculatus]